MEIIKGGKPDPEPEEDTFLYDLLLTAHEVDEMLRRGQITQGQYNKLINEVD